ncbi:aminotransferase [Mesobaculum littorinae]|uniref:Aminotransferase n=1 Tax=Mesobaculum littorinae TaxID=2486419 RepID=A0A438AE30_9RHOB|nr:DegT/DnrJ/EryC1/StrS family aminotransferase [Mesobaculum littorinae]RVV96944.1 aminotransferase [Mesobaculum littorinae]
MTGRSSDHPSDRPSDRFRGSFTRQSPLPEAAIAAATEVLRHGRLHRYTLAPGEAGEATLLEEEFAAWQGARYCVALASGGQALAIALRAAGVRPDEPVLTNAFTLAPVPGAIAAVGARPVLVEVAEDLTIDLDDLAARATETGARWLLLSHMRGHICDMDRLCRVADAAGLRVIEDCAHTMGARWDGVRSGRHGIAACFSTQTYKHMNSGEGGLLTTDDPDLAARAVLMSGSYMLYDRHRAAPGTEVFDRHRTAVPNMSARMDDLRAAILRPQLAGLDAACAEWTALYRVVEAGLRGTPGLTLIDRPAREGFVGSSIQFRLQGWSARAIGAVLEGCAARGVDLRWFGAARAQGYTSTYRHWGGAAGATPDLPRTDAVLAGLIDMRLPLSFSREDGATVARIVSDEVSHAQALAGDVAE